MAKKGKMTEEQKKKLPKRFRDNMGRFRSTATDVQREIASKGGEAKAEKERRTRELRELLQSEMPLDILMLLGAKMLPGINKIYEEFGLPIENGNNLMAIFMGMMRKAQSGDPTAAKFVLEVAGLYTETKNMNVKIQSDKRDLLIVPKEMQQ